jgi:O-antigen ligase
VWRGSSEPVERLAAAGTALWLVAPWVSVPGFDRDSIRLPALLAAAILVTGAALWRGLRRGELTARREPTLWIAGFGWTAAAAAHAANGARAWGLAPLGLGLAGLCVYLALSRGWVGRAFTARWGTALLAVPATLSAVYVLAQVGGWDPIHWGPRIEPAAAFGNTSDAGCMLAIAGVVLVVGAGGQAGIARRAAVFCCGALCLAATWATGSHTARIAAVVGLLIAAAATRPKFLLPASILLLGVLGVTRHWLAGLPEFQVRLGVWRGVWSMARDRPALGVGPGGFHSAFVPYRDAREYRLSHAGEPPAYREVPHAHNAYLQALAETGWVGAAALVLLVYVLLRRWMFFTGHQADPSSRWRTAAAGGGIVAFAVAALTQSLFDSAAPAALFWFLASQVEGDGNRRPLARPAPFGGPPLAAAAGAVLLLSLCLGLVWHSAGASWEYHRALLEREPGPREERLRRALEWDHREWRARYRLGADYRMAGRFAEASAELEAALREHPNHALSWMELGIVKAQTPGAFDAALEAFARAEKLAPLYPKLYHNRGVALQSKGREEEARRDFERAAALAAPSGP